MLSLPPAGGTGKKIDPAKLFGEDKYDQYYQELLSEGRIDGDNVSPDERKEGVKAYKRGKIDFEKFVNKVLEVRDELTETRGTIDPSKLKFDSVEIVPNQNKLEAGIEPEPDVPDGLDDLLNDIRAEQDDLQAKIDALLEEVRKEDDVDGLNARLDDLLDNIRTMNEIEEQQAEVKRQKEEKKKRKAKEKKLESFKKFIFAPIKKAFQPVQNFLQKFFDAVIKLVLGKAFIKLIDWFSDPENRSKITSIFRFIKDFWPAIAAGFLLVGGALGLLGLKILGPIALAVGALVALTAGLAALAKALGFGPGEQEEKTEKALKEDFDGDKQKMIDALKEQKENLNLFEKMQGKGAEIDEQIYRLETGKTKSYGFGGDTPDTVDKDATPPSADKNVTPSKDKAPQTVSGRFDTKAMQGYINEQPVPLEEYEAFTNMSDEEKVQKYGAVKLNVGGVVPEEMSLLQRLDQNFGDLPFIGGVIKTALGYEDRINYRNADPRLREMMGLTKSKPQPMGLQFRDLPGMSGGGGGTNALTNQPKVRSIPGILGDLFGGFRKKEIDPQTILGDTSPIGTDTVPAMLTPGETVLQVGARERMMDMIGIDPLMFNIGPNANKPKVRGERQGFSGGGQVGNKHPHLQKLDDANIKKASAPMGYCVTGSLDTMLKSGVPEPAATGNDAGNNPRGAISQLMQSPFNWKSMGGSAITLRSPYGEVKAGVYNKNQYSKLVDEGKVPSGALVFQSRFDDWNGTSPGSSGYDMAIAQQGGKTHWNGQPMPKFVYGASTKKIIVLTPDGKQGDGEDVKITGEDNVPPSSAGYSSPVVSGASNPVTKSGGLAPPSSKPAAGAQGTVPVPIPVGGQQKPPSPNSDVPSISSVDGHNVSLYVMRSMYNLTN